MSDDERREPWLDEVISRLKEGEGPDPAAEGRTMARVREEAGSAFPEAADASSDAARRTARGEAAPGRDRLWFFRPRRLMVSPLGFCLAGLAVVCLMAGELWVVRDRVRVAASHSGSPVSMLAKAVPASTGADVHPALFALLQPKATSVSIVGDFNNWDPSANPLQPQGDGIWDGVVMLPRGVYSYAYMVDGQIRVAPDTRPSLPADDFGTGRSILVVGKESI